MIKQLLFGFKPFFDVPGMSPVTCDPYRWDSLQRPRQDRPFQIRMITAAHPEMNSKGQVSWELPPQLQRKKCIENVHCWYQVIQIQISHSVWALQRRMFSSTDREVKTVWNQPWGCSTKRLIKCSQGVDSTHALKSYRSDPFQI